MPRCGGGAPDPFCRGDQCRHPVRGIQGPPRIQRGKLGRCKLVNVTFFFFFPTSPPPYFSPSPIRPVGAQPWASAKSVLGTLGGSWLHSLLLGGGCVGDVTAVGRLGALRQLGGRMLELTAEVS